MEDGEQNKKQNQAGDWHDTYQNVMDSKAEDDWFSGRSFHQPFWVEDQHLNWTKPVECIPKFQTAGDIFSQIQTAGGWKTYRFLMVFQILDPG